MKMTRFTVHIFLGLIIVFASLNIGKYSSDAAEPTKTLKLATLYSEGKELFKSVQFFCNEVEKRTKGKVSFRIFPGNSLVPAKQALSGVHTGVVDAAFVPAAYEQQLWPITGITMTFGAPNITYGKWRNIHDPIREIMNHNLNINVVILGMPHVLDYFFYAKFPLTGTLKDFDRALVRSAGGAYDASFKALGCAPVKIPATEVYMALQKGTIDSGWNIFSRYVEAKLYEVAQNVVVVPEGMVISGQHFVINKSIWESLSSNIQRILLQVGTDVVAFTNDRSAASDKKIIDVTLPELGIKPIIMSKEENKRVLARLMPVWGPVKEKLGEPGKEIAALLGVE
jgi:TRAP-type C4-dicarboxylate transport system substrate-binding protein